MSIPTVAAVIPTYNRCHKTLRFLANISCQSYPGLEIFLVDSNSSDGTPQLVNKEYPKVALLNASERDYWAEATNIGVRSALQRGVDYILTINDDSVVAPDYVENLVNVALNKKALVLGSRVDYLSQPNLIWSMGTFANWGRSNFITLHCHQCWFDELIERVVLEKAICVDALPGNGVLVHRSVYETIGLYNSLMTPHYHADTEFTLRATRQGFQVWVAPYVVLLNDFSEEQKIMPIRSWQTLRFAFFSKKSHLFLLPWLYLFFKYCPLDKKLTTVLQIPVRLRKLIR